jgi:hypothetical protein
MGEGQLEVPKDRLEELNELDSALADAVTQGDERAFERDLALLLDRVRAVGTPVADHVIAVSEHILPGPGSSLAEVRSLLGEEGLIPG